MQDFQHSLDTYVGGAFNFSQEALKRFFADHGEKSLQEGAEKKGVSTPAMPHFLLIYAIQITS